MKKTVHYEICDLCGRDLDNSLFSPIKIRCKRKGMNNKWQRIDVCGYCVRAIEERSTELRKGDKT